MIDVMALQSAIAGAIKAEFPAFQEVRTYYGFQAMQSAMGVVNSPGVSGGLGVKNPACLLTIMQAQGYEPHMTGEFDVDLRVSAFVMASGQDREKTATDLAFSLMSFVAFKTWGLARVKVPTDLRCALLNVPTLNSLGVFGFIVSWFQPIRLGEARTPWTVQPHPDQPFVVTDPGVDAEDGMEGVGDPNTWPPYPFPHNNTP